MTSARVSTPLINPELKSYNGVIYSAAKQRAKLLKISEILVKILSIPNKRQTSRKRDSLFFSHKSIPPVKYILTTIVS